MSKLRSVIKLLAASVVFYVILIQWASVSTSKLSSSFGYLAVSQDSSSLVPDKPNTNNNQDIYADFKRPKMDVEVNGHKITFNKKYRKRDPKKIRLHLVFHSHVDPGWLRTFEEYYMEQTSKILNSAVEALNKYPTLRYIWSETSFLERWWTDKSTTEQQRTDMKGHVASGRLEVSGGAWVMTDEATPLFYPFIENLIEGHQWLKEELGTVPNTSWSVDPFGHGSMMPHLLPKAGIEYMVIGRFHDHVKESMRIQQNLRWRWNEQYSNDASSGPLVNSLPYFVYTTESAFPSLSIGKCFHVGPSSRAPCNTNRLSDRMNDTITEKMALLFLKQMREVQDLYGTENHLVAIGDDFFFREIGDFDVMFGGFNKLAEYINTHPNLNAEVRFSTVSEFFSSIKDDAVPSLRGDLFPYTSNAQNPQPWWTGYYVHRPHSKRIERVLQNSLRSLDLARVFSGRMGNFVELRKAKRALSLFQHHDGITGTSKKHVMKDYETRMKAGYDEYSNTFPSSAMNVKAQMELSTPDARPSILRWNNGTRMFVSLFHPGTQSSEQIIRIFSEKPATVTRNGAAVIVQTKLNSSGVYGLSFRASLAALSLTVFQLDESAIAETSKTHMESPIGFDSQGAPIALKIGEHLKQFRVSLFSVADGGGSYVFSPHARGLPINATVESFTESSGPIEYRRKLKFKTTGTSMTLISSGADGMVDIHLKSRPQMGETLVLRIETDTKEDGFHTDVNGLFHVRRNYQENFESKSPFSLPWEANFYPVAASAFVQDDEWRMTLITGQPTALTSRVPGQVELLVDRLLMNDDGKGLPWDEALDNRTTLVKYRILFEKRIMKDSPSSLVSPAHSTRGYSEWNRVLYPPIMMFHNKSVEPYSLLPISWPCGIQLVSWRPLSDTMGLLVLRNIVYDDTVVAPGCKNNVDVLYEWLSSMTSLQHTSLSGNSDGQSANLESFQNSLRKPYDIASFKTPLPLNAP